MEQWYKNILIVTAFLFTGHTLTPPALLLGFLGLCALSSVTYIFNDWMDREKDKLHPQKKDRPLASGKVNGAQALVIALALLGFNGWVSFTLGGLYPWASLAYFVATNAYSLGLKNIPLLDIGLILLNFNLRTLAGFSEVPTPHEGVYFALLTGLVLFSITSKRKADRTLLGEKALAHKPVLTFYTLKVTRLLIVLAYILVLGGVITLALQESKLPLGLLFVMMVLYTQLCFKRNPHLAIKPHYLFKNPVWTLLLASLLTLPLL